MKRIITILAAGAFMLGVTACGGKDSKSHVTEENNESVEFSVSEMDIPADVSTDNDTLSVDFDEADITDTDTVNVHLTCRHLTYFFYAIG